MGQSRIVTIAVAIVIAKAPYDPSGRTWDFIIFVWLFVSSIKTGTSLRRIRLDDLSSVERFALNDARQKKVRLDR